MSDVIWSGLDERYDHAADAVTAVETLVDKIESGEVSVGIGWNLVKEGGKQRLVITCVSFNLADESGAGYDERLQRAVRSWQGDTPNE